MKPLLWMLGLDLALTAILFLLLLRAFDQDFIFHILLGYTYPRLEDVIFYGVFQTRQWSLITSESGWPSVLLLLRFSVRVIGAKIGIDSARRYARMVLKTEDQSPAD